MTGIEPDPERVACLRETADDLQDRGSAAESLGAILYRISDLYDPAEETTPMDVYRNMQIILRVKEATDGGESPE